LTLRIANPNLKALAMLLADGGGNYGGIRYRTKLTPQEKFQQMEQTAWMAVIGTAVPGAKAGTGNTLAKSRVFWTGGTQAEQAAIKWATVNKGEILQAPNVHTPYPVIKHLSKEFARSASGEVHIFQSAASVRLESIWATIEYPALMSNPNAAKMTFHVIMQNGRVITLP
jgi:hypothetical protein